jgi:hypothetical protein
VTPAEELVTGILEHAGLYESRVGVRDRCVVFLRVGTEQRMLIFDADIRDHLPIGRRVQLRYRASLNDDTVTLLERKLL